MTDVAHGRLGFALGTGTLSEERLGFYLRLAAAVAMLSVLVETALDLEGNLRFERWHLVAASAGMALATPGVLVARFSRPALALFGACLVVYAATKWAAYHNHGWLSVWTLPVAAAFGARWWESDLFRWYLRATLGVVMLAAAAQKLLAGTYLDGSYITYLSLHGEPTERMFAFLCGEAAAQGSCAAHRALGTFLVAWQIGVGLLLLAGLRSLLFLFVEVGFLLGAGLFADEMNFQVLNVALLTIAFGYSMRPWLCAACLALLALDAVGIGTVVAHVL
ncbi:MAG: hypothetical protein ACFBWO_09855 [Paracoccaceae bacterium]